MANLLNRRGALAGALAFLPAFAVGALSQPMADPVFGAIERHRAAWERFEATSPLIDEVVAERNGRTVTEADEAEYEAANDAETALFLALLSTAPQTKAGAQALINYASAFDLGIIDDALETLFATLLRSPLIAGEA